MRSQKVHSISNNKREEDLQLHTVVTNQESKVVVLPILTARSHTCMSFSILGLFVVAFAKKRSREMEILCLQKKSGTKGVQDGDDDDACKEGNA